MTSPTDGPAATTYAASRSRRTATASHHRDRHQIHRCSDGQADLMRRRDPLLERADGGRSAAIGKRVNVGRAPAFSFVAESCATSRGAHDPKSGELRQSVVCCVDLTSTDDSAGGEDGPRRPVSLHECVWSSPTPATDPVRVRLDSGVLMAKVFYPPPNWPKPPRGWSPAGDWRPDAAWGPAPEGWQFWVEEGQQPVSDDDSPPRSSPRTRSTGSSGSRWARLKQVAPNRAQRTADDARVPGQTEKRIFISYRRSDCQP